MKIWCGLYVELNPVRAGLVARPENWRWSSYRFYAFGALDPLMEELIDVDTYYLELRSNSQERQERYRQNVEGIMKEKFLQDIRKKLDEGVFGREDFVKEAKEKFKIKSLRPRGRPKSEEK